MVGAAMGTVPIGFLILITMGTGQSPQVIVEPTVTIAEFADTLPVTQISGIAVTRSGDVWIGQPLQGGVARLDSDGAFLEMIGRRGSGPGEFGFIEHVYAYGDSVLVVDGQGRMTSIFLDDRWIDFWRGFRIPGVQRMVPQPPTGIFGDGSLLVEGRGTARDADPDRRIALARYHPVEGFLNLIGNARRGTSFIRASDPEAGLAMYFTPPVHAGDSWMVVPDSRRLVLLRQSMPEGNLATANVVIMDYHGRTIRTIKLSAPIRRASPEAYDREIQDLADRAVRNRPFPRDLLLKMARNAMPRPERLPLFDTLFVDVCERIWLRESGFGLNEVRWLLYSQEGEELGSVILPEVTRPVASTRAAVWGHTEGAAGEPLVVRYEIPSLPCDRVAMD